MNFGGLEEFTLQDYPGKVAAIVFTKGCNFNCLYCNNTDLLNEENFKKSGRKDIPEKEILEYLEKNKKMLDGVVLTGGETSLDLDIIDFIKKVKEQGFAVKFDTNGSDPKLLKYLIDKKLIDYIAMDIKAPFQKYHEITRVLVDLEAIKKSIELIKNSKLEHEFRTTLSNRLDIKDYEKISEVVDGSKWFLQKNIYEHPSIDVYKFLKEISKDKKRDFHYRE